MTHFEALKLSELPERLLLIGGGYMMLYGFRLIDSMVRGIHASLRSR